MSRPHPTHKRVWEPIYRPPALPSPIVLVLLVVFALLSFGKGFDYFFGANDHIAQSVIVLERLGGLQFWGATLMLGGFSLLLGLVLQKHYIVWFSHIYLVALFFCFVIMLSQGVAHYDGDGFSELVLPMAGVLWHGTFVYLSRPNFSESENEVSCAH